jgi:hypothetical protein
LWKINLEVRVLRSDVLQHGVDSLEFEAASCTRRAVHFNSVLQHLLFVGQKLIAPLALFLFMQCIAMAGERFVVCGGLATVWTLEDFVLLFIRLQILFPDFSLKIITMLMNICNSARI